VLFHELQRISFIRLLFFYQAFEMVFKGLGVKEDTILEYDFDRVCGCEVSVFDVMRNFFVSETPDM
jgi:hypothetical protein